jgi:hypothetical protein
MGRNPITRSAEEQSFRDNYIRQHARSKGAAKAWKRKQQRLSGRPAIKTNLVRSPKMSTAVAIIPGNTVVDHIAGPPQTVQSVKIYNAETNKSDDVDPHDIGLFQKLVGSWSIFGNKKTSTKSRR